MMSERLLKLYVAILICFIFMIMPAIQPLATVGVRNYIQPVLFLVGPVFFLLGLCLVVLTTMEELPQRLEKSLFLTGMAAMGTTVVASLCQFGGLVVEEPLGSGFLQTVLVAACPLLFMLGASYVLFILGKKWLADWKRERGV